MAVEPVTDMSDLLDDADIADRLPPGWQRDGDTIVRTFEYDKYLHGVNFAQLIGEISEAKMHHPEMILRYKELEVRFTTHDAGGITAKDIEMAELINTEQQEGTDL